MNDFLLQMATASAERAARVRRYRSADFDRPVLPLALDAFEVIAEIKARSPAEGALAGAAYDRAERARQYAAGGAAAISVLTEPSRFDGALEHLAEVAGAVPELPVMRKDFLVEPAQVLEARAAGASGVLLIVGMLADDKLRAMLDAAFEHGLFVLLESFAAADIDRLHAFLTPRDLDAAAGRRLLFGVNARNLRTLEVDPGASHRWPRACRTARQWPKAASGRPRTPPPLHGSAIRSRWSARRSCGASNRRR